MNELNHGHGGSSPLGNAPDVTSKANIVIWMYFVAFGVALYAMITLVDIYFRNETDKERYIKIGSVESKELLEHRAMEAEVLAGKRGLLEGKKHISIDDAMNRILEVTQ